MLSTTEILKQVWQKFGKGPKFHFFLIMEMLAFAFVFVGILFIAIEKIFFCEDVPSYMEIASYMSIIAPILMLFLCCGWIKESLDYTLGELLKKDHPKWNGKDLDWRIEDIMAGQTMRLLYPFAVLVILLLVVVALEVQLPVMFAEFVPIGLLSGMGIICIFLSVNSYFFFRAVTTLIWVFYEDRKIELQDIFDFLYADKEGKKKGSEATNKVEE